jgi:flagellar protein FliS
MYTSVTARSASAYKRVGLETSVDGASPHRLVSLLFDALLQAVSKARAALARGDIEAKGREITRAVNILELGLSAGLSDEDAQAAAITQNLRAVYSYSVNRLTLANLKNDDRLLVEVRDLIVPIADAWNQVRDEVAGAVPHYAGV